MEDLAELPPLDYSQMQPTLDPRHVSSQVQSSSKLDETLAALTHNTLLTPMPPPQATGFHVPNVLGPLGGFQPLPMDSQESDLSKLQAQVRDFLPTNFALFMPFRPFSTNTFCSPRSPQQGTNLCRVRVLEVEGDSPTPSYPPTPHPAIFHV